MTAPTAKMRELARRARKIALATREQCSTTGGARVVAQALADEHAAGIVDGVEEAAKRVEVSQYEHKDVLAAAIRALGEKK